MRALLVESKDEKRSAMVLLPSGKLELDAGDPANIIVELDINNLRVWVLTPDELALFKDDFKEVEVDSYLVVSAIQYMHAVRECEIRKLEFKDRLLNEMITPNCDALTFLVIGSVVL